MILGVYDVPNLHLREHLRAQTCLYYLCYTCIVQLRHFFLEQELEKSFSLVSLLGLAFAILNSALVISLDAIASSFVIRLGWVAMATSLSIALPSGGPTAVIWGIIVAGIGSLALAASLAEICAVYPTGTLSPISSGDLEPTKLPIQRLGNIIGPQCYRRQSIQEF